MRAVCRARPAQPYPFLARVFRSGVEELPDVAADDDSVGAASSSEPIMKYLETFAISSTIQAALEECLRVAPALEEAQAVEFIAARLEQVH